MARIRGVRVAVRAISLLLLVSVGSSFIVITGVPQIAAQTQTALRSRPLPPVQYIPQRDYDTRHIALDLKFNWEREQAMVTATITFAPLTTNLKRVQFDAANMTFRSVTLKGGSALRFDSDSANEKLGVTLDRVYQPADLVTVVISYSTNGPTDDSAKGNGGLTFIKPTPNEPSNPRQIWSQGESDHNHDWFPCFDHPNDFATSEMTATVEKPMRVISNGRLLEERDNNDGTRTFHWKMEQPHASYLTSIVVGDFATVEQSYDGVPIISYVYANQIEEAKLTVKRVPDMMRFFTEKTGLRFPNAKYGQVFVSGFGGGMENITATTMSDQTIHDARTEVDRTQDGLLAHELAHSWFGDYVTCRSWSDLWLNESFASYFAALWDEHLLGHDEFLYRDVKGNQDPYLRAWKQNVRRPIVTKNFREPDALFDVYAYSRGAAVLHMLRTTLGEDDWWRAIRHYLAKYPHQPVETEQLRIAIEESTGQALDWFFDEWVYRMGHPVFRVTQKFDPAARTLTLNVRQEQKTDPNNQYPQTSFFRMPVDIEIGTAGSTRVERVLIKPQEEQSFTFAMDSLPLLVNFDYGRAMLKELQFDKNVDELVYQVQHDADLLGRSWALSQLETRMRDKSTSEADRRRITTVLATSLSVDKFWGLRVEAATALSGVADPEARAALLFATKDAKAAVRAEALTSLSASADPTLADVYASLLSDPSYAVVGEASRALGATKAPRAFDALQKLVTSPSWRDSVRASALSGLAALADPRALEIGLRYTEPSNPRDVRLAAITLLGEVGKGDVRIFPIIAAEFSRAISAGNLSRSEIAAKALVALGDMRALDLFVQARKTATRPEAQFVAKEAEDKLRQKGNSGAAP